MKDTMKFFEDCGIELEEGTVILDDCVEAIIGLDTQDRIVYSFSKLVEMYMKEGMSYEEAVEYIEFNTIRALPYMGENHPIIVRDDFIFNN